jgi:F0F1-type ATP synthase membrane subunit b/b'
MTEKINNYYDEAIKNIREDRDRALSLLKDIADYIGQNQDRHKDVGNTAAKYLETLQRSNEQLVKITALLQKQKEAEFGELDKSDTDELYDEIEVL